jgi:hypothetical protein
VLAREQEGGPLATEVPLEGGGVPLELGLELGVRCLGEQLDGRLEVRCAGEDVPPQGDLGPEAIGLAEDFLGVALVVPEPGLLGQRVELGDAVLFRLEVKDAPTSTGSVQRGRGWRTRPPSSGPADPGAATAEAR